MIIPNIWENKKCSKPPTRNACFSKRQHWKRWPKLFLRPCPMLLWWLECSLCISIGRVWTTLVHKASAVPDMSMWRGLHMIATWKMASEQLGNKCYQYRTCHTCCFQKTMGNDRQTAEEWNFGTWLGSCLDQNADLLLEHSYKEETKESANVDPHLVPQLHHALKSQVHQSWPTFTKILEPTSQLFVSFR